MPHASFYILSADKNPLQFACQLTQTVLTKSDDGLAIFCPENQLNLLDDKLWSFSDTAFIPHSLLDPIEKNQPAMGVMITADRAFIRQFDGIVMNMTQDTLTDFNGSRLLEIIGDAAKATGREKYRVYQQLGCQLNTFQL